MKKAMLMKIFRKITFNIVCVAAMVFFSQITATAHEWMAPRGMAKIQNPLPVKPEIISHGKRLYLQLCSYCHGENLAGLSGEITGLTKPTPNLKARLKTHSDGDFFWKIQHGKGDMPSFKDELEDEEIWSILQFTRSELN